MSNQNASLDKLEALNAKLAKLDLNKLKAAPKADVDKLMSEISRAKREVAPLSVRPEKGEKTPQEHVLVMELDMERDYLTKFLLTAMVGYLNRACDEYLVPKNVPVVTVYDYIQHPELCDDPEPLSDGEKVDPETLKAYAENREIMQERIIIKKFLERQFQCDPDDHVRGGYNPNYADGTRKLVYTPAAKVSVLLNERNMSRSKWASNAEKRNAKAVKDRYLSEYRAIHGDDPVMDKPVLAATMDEPTENSRANEVALPLPRPTPTPAPTHTPEKTQDEVALPLPRPTPTPAPTHTPEKTQDEVALPLPRPTPTSAHTQNDTQDTQPEPTKQDAAKLALDIINNGATEKPYRFIKVTRKLKNGETTTYRQRVHKDDYQKYMANPKLLTGGGKVIDTSDKPNWSDYFDKQVAAMDQSLHRTVRDMIPPGEYGHKFLRYTHNNFEGILDAVQDLYCDKPELLKARYIFAQRAKNAEEAAIMKEKYASGHCLPIISMPTKTWVITQEVKENRDKVALTKDLAIVDEILKTKEAESMLGKDLLEKRIKTDRSHNRKDAGAQDAGLSKYTSEYNQFAKAGASAADDVMDDAIEIGITTISNGGLKVSKDKFHSAAEAPTFMNR
jgi:hypothetical protein